MIRVKGGEPRVKEGVHPDLSDKYGENPLRVKGVNLFSNIAPKKGKKTHIESKVSSSIVLPFTPFTLDDKSAANDVFLGVHPLYKIKRTKPLQTTDFYRVNPQPFTPFTPESEVVMQKDLSMNALRSGRKSTYTITATYTEEPSPTPNEDHGESPARLQAVAEVFEWLEARRRQVSIPADSPEMQEILAAVEEHRDYLNERWHDGSDEEFKESLRRYARAVSQEMLRSYKARTASAQTGAHEPQVSAQTSLEDA